MLSLSDKSSVITLERLPIAGSRLSISQFLSFKCSSFFNSPIEEGIFTTLQLDMSKSFSNLRSPILSGIVIGSSSVLLLSLSSKLLSLGNLVIVSKIDF